MKPSEIPPVGSKVVLGMPALNNTFTMKGTIMSEPSFDIYAKKGTVQRCWVIKFRRYREQIPIYIPIADIITCWKGW